MAPPILHLRDIHLSFGGTPLLTGVELVVQERDRICLVGRNGSGKSTLMKIAAGVIEADKGDIFRQPGTTIAYLSQEPDFTGFETTLEFVTSGLSDGHDPYLGQVYLEQLGLRGDEDPRTLSGGEARRCGLARVLTLDPDILLLDEPTNHLDLAAIEWLEGELKSLRGAIVMVSHDRRILENLSKRTVWLFQGLSRSLDQGFKNFETWREKQLAEWDEARHQLNKKIAREMDWLHKGVTARRKRNQGRLRALNELRAQRKAGRQTSGGAPMSASDADMSGKRVADLKHVVKDYGDGPVVDDLSIRVMRGDRLGIVGPNGAGKTTMIRLMLGETEASSGEVTLGTNLHIATLDQKREKLDPTWTLAEAITSGTGDTVEIGGERRHIMGYLQDFLFTPEQARTPVSRLSGGERGRLALARALAKASNLMILDEPTNDLDIETLDLLQEMLGNYAGTVILVSHDRDFLDRTVTSVVAYEGKGKWVEYAGGYTDMVEQRGKGLEEVRENQEPARRSNTAKPKKGKSGGQSQKLSYKQKHALEVLPGKIEALESEVAELQSRLADPDFYNRDPAGYDSVTQQLGSAETSLSEMEEEWLELEMLREEINAG